MNKLVIKQKLLLGGRDEKNRNLKKVERTPFETREFTSLWLRHEKEKHEKFYGHFERDCLSMDPSTGWKQMRCNEKEIKFS